jgi:hypothetical protein
MIHAASDSAQKLPLSSELRKVPETASFGKAVLSLTAYIWRDFMPMAVSRESNLAEIRGGRPMIASIQLVSQDGMPLPSTLHAEIVWIVQGDAVWESKAIEERHGDSGTYEFVIRGGPKLQPRSYVDVIVRLVDGKGAAFNLALRHQDIKAVS